jgi:hypothetical protein
MTGSDSSATPIWKSIRNAVANEQIYRLRWPTDMDSERLREQNVATISDWGLYQDAGIRLTDDGDIFEPDTVDTAYADRIKGQIKWEKLRDSIHETQFSEQDSKVQAGHAIGHIRRFVEDVSEGDIFLGLFQIGIVPGIVKGPARYDTASAYTELGESQVIYRRVDWATTEEEPLAIDPEILPAGFGPGRQTIMPVHDPAQMVELLRFAEWISDTI